jgi:acyl carrier protein
MNHQKIEVLVLACLQLMADREKSLPVKLDDHLEADLGIDSLEKIDVMMNLEDLFDVEIPDKAMATLFTAKDIVEYLKSVLTEEKKEVTA